MSKAQAHSVQTSAHLSEDLFAGTPDAAPKFQVRGTLAQDAEIRIKTIGADGVPLPVLCLELREVGPGRHTVHAEQVHTEATRHRAEALVQSLKAGREVTVTASLQHMRLVLPFVELVQLTSSH